MEILGEGKIEEKVPSPVEFGVESYVSGLLTNNLSQLIETCEKGCRLRRESPGHCLGRMIPSMAGIGQKFQTGDIYIPEITAATKVISETMFQSDTRLC